MVFIQVPNDDNVARRSIYENWGCHVFVQGKRAQILERQRLALQFSADFKKQKLSNSIAPKIIACMQAEASKVLELCAREATMIFGGNAQMIGGVGDKIECSVAQVKA